MAEYQLTTTTEPCAVIREVDKACIPPDMANRDYNGSPQSPGYLQWKEAGGVPDPYVPPPPVTPQADPQTAVLFDHENRILAQEGKPPLTMADFVTKMNTAPAPKAKRGK